MCVILGLSASPCCSRYSKSVSESRRRRQVTILLLHNWFTLIEGMACFFSIMRSLDTAESASLHLTL